MPDAHAPVLLISCYELGHEPLGIAIPGSALRRARIGYDTIDLAVEDMDDARLRGADLIVVSTPMHTALRLAVRVARRARQLRPDIHIAMMGIYAPLQAQHLRDIADTCIGPDDSEAVVSLARAIEARTGATAPRDVRMPATAAGRSVLRSAAMRFSPDRSQIRRRERYVKLQIGEERRRVGQTLSTIGCRHLCRHCPLPPVYGGRFRAIPVDDVLRDIDHLVRDGARHITFSDPDFLNGPRHALLVANGLAHRHPGITFDYTAKVSHLRAHLEMVRELRSIGNIFVVSAIESFNDDVLSALDKGHTRADALHVIQAFADMGHVLRPTFVPFTPWETLSSYHDLLSIVAREGLAAQVDPVQLTLRLLVPTGSLLCASSAMIPFLGVHDAERFSVTWAHPDPRMDALQLELASAVEVATRADSSTDRVFHAIVTAASHAQDSGRVPFIDGDRWTRQVGAQTPGLTEAWFC